MIRVPQALSVGLAGRIALNHGILEHPEGFEGAIPIGCQVAVDDPGEAVAAIGAGQMRVRIQIDFLPAAAFEGFDPIATHRRFDHAASRMRPLFHAGIFDDPKRHHPWRP
jgi:hypothetical protein